MKALLQNIFINLYTRSISSVFAYVLIWVFFCTTGVRCQDTVEGFRCGPCPDGYIGDGQRCRPRGCDMSPCSPGTYTRHAYMLYI